MADTPQTTRRAPRGWIEYLGHWMPYRKVKRLVRKAMERDGGFSRRQCYEPIWWPK